MNKEKLDQNIVAMNREHRRQGWVFITLGVVLGSLTFAVAVAVSLANNANDQVTEINETTERRDERLLNMEEALDAQRAQFKLCKDKKDGAPECVAPVTPSSKEIGPRGPRGKPGPAGPTGPAGPGLESFKFKFNGSEYSCSSISFGNYVCTHSAGGADPG